MVYSHVAIKSLLAKHGYKSDNLPIGVIITTCQLVNCLRVMENHETWAVLEDGRIVSGNDFFFGDYKAGGYVWEVKDMKILDRFIPAKGRLGLWEYDIVACSPENRCFFFGDGSHVPEIY